MAIRTFREVGTLFDMTIVVVVTWVVQDGFDCIKTLIGILSDSCDTGLMLNQNNLSIGQIPPPPFANAKFLTAPIPEPPLLLKWKRGSSKNPFNRSPSDWPLPPGTHPSLQIQSLFALISSFIQCRWYPGPPQPKTWPSKKLPLIFTSAT